MLNLIWAQSRNWTSRVLDRQSTPPRHFYGSPAVIPFLVALCAVALLIWFWMDSDQLEGILSVNQARAAFDAFVTSMGDQIIKQRLPLKLVRLVPSDSSDVDEEGDQQLRVMTVPIDQYPSVAKLEAKNGRILDDKAIFQMRKMVRRLPEAACIEKWSNIILVDASRFSNVIEDSWRRHKYPNTFADGRELTEKSTYKWVSKWKNTARLLCLMRCQLNEQGFLCQNLKEDYFAKVAGPHLQALLEDVSAFSNTSWTTGDISNMVPIFEAFLDTLCHIKQSINRPDLLHANFADIFHKVVDAFKDIIGGSENNLERSKECAIISATYCLIVALEFFDRNKNVQPILASTALNYTINLCDCWISKVKEDAERLFPNKEGHQYIFILNNIYFVWERKCGGEGFLSVEILKDWFKTLMNKYIDMYVDQYWAPLLLYIEGDYLINPCHPYLYKFIEEFDKNCDSHMNLKVRQPELRNTIRKRIRDLLVGPYDKFLVSLVEARAVGPSSESSNKKQKGFGSFRFGQIIKGITRNGKVDIGGTDIDVYTVRSLTDVILNLFEG